MNVRFRLALILAFAGICLIWGTTWLAIKIGLRDAPPVTAVGLRFIIAGLVLYIVAAIRGHIVPVRALPWKLVVVYGTCLFGFNYCLTYFSEEGLTSGLTAVLFATMPFFAFAQRALFFGEATTRTAWIGTVIAFAGVALISLEGDVRGSWPYALAILGAAALSAYANLYGKTRPEVEPLVVLPPAMLLSGLAVASAGFVFERPHLASFLVPSSLGAMLYLALFGSALAFFLNSWLLARIDVGTLNLAPLIFPIVALIAGVAVAHETVSPAAAAGVALVIAGTWYALVRRAPKTAATA